MVNKNVPGFRCVVIVLAALFSIVVGIFVARRLAEEPVQATKANDIVRITVYHKRTMDTAEAIRMELAEVSHRELDARVVTEGVRKARFDRRASPAFQKSGGQVGVARLENGEERRVIVVSDGCIIIAGQRGTWRMPKQSGEWLKTWLQMELYRASHTTMPANQP